MRTSIGLMCCWMVLGVWGCDEGGSDEVSTAAESASGGATDAASGTDPSASTTPGETTAAETGDTEGDPLPGWCDVAQDQCGGTSFATFECGSPVVCDALVVRDPSLNAFGEGPITFDNPDAASCILAALRDDVVGTHEIEVEPGDAYGYHWTIEAFGDGTIVVARLGQEDKCFTHWSTWALRRDDAHFEACLEAADDAAMYACLVDPVDPAACVDAPVVCPGGEAG